MSSAMIIYLLYVKRNHSTSQPPPSCPCGPPTPACIDWGQRRGPSRRGPKIPASAKRQIRFKRAEDASSDGLTITSASQACFADSGTLCKPPVATVHSVKRP